jgi:signal peptidase I
MEPTLECARPAPGCEARYDDELLVEPAVSAPRRGDIIVFRTPPLAQVRCGAGGTFVKRVVGLPGETVSERSGYLFIGRKKLGEAYIQSERRDHEPPHTWPRVATGHYFVVGDNRAQSCDSRVWGTVMRKDIVGTVVTIYRRR